MAQLHFHIDFGELTLVGRPKYVIEDYAFDFEIVTPAQWQETKGPSSRTSLAIDTLQLELWIEQSLCLYVWGYCPHLGWKCSPVSPPPSRPGALRVVHDTAFIAGVSVGIEGMVPPTSHFNPESGWFCIGNLETPSGSQAVEFATDTLAAVQGGKIVSLWVKPENCVDIAKQLLKT